MLRAGGLNRRQTIRSLAGGGLLLPGLLSEMFGSTAADPLSPKQPHYPAKAKRVIFLFMTGGVSHVDTFDPKPFLRQNHDQWHNKNRVYKGADWEFRPYGQSGIEVSDLFPHTGKVIDDIAVVRSMTNINGDHFGATLGIHTGSATFNRPSIGSWVSYGLGTFNQNLPSFMVIAPEIPYAGGQVWGSDFLPVLHQGTRIVPGDEPIAHMSQRTSGDQQRTELDLLEYFNRQHLQGRERDTNLAARIKSYETAFGMQVEAPEAFDLTKESDATLKMYGLERGSTDGFAWQCLVGRRLVERGVRFVELIDGGTSIDKNWDTHAKMANYNRMAKNVDQPIGALIRDLKSRGMLDDTLVVFTTEFGRTPTCPSPGTEGRGHHAKVYSSWLAGGGVKGGMVYGSSDEMGYDIAENPVTVHDFQATILDRLGLDHERLTYRHAGRDFRLTDVHGHVVKDILT
ncbi:MAG: DUF1501 domain-containing protein [Bryobacterales bacterium]|nr:DUF1501 domain-containing protein [Bryobacterales bacterium]MDE0623804.1 DUF1501 domain-containing protein [Bryobacterales bacterium]